MSASPRRTLLLVLGAVMIGIALFIALRPLIAPGRPVTGQWWLDLAFAFFFFLRGAWNVRVATRPPRGPTVPPGPGA